VVPVAKVAYGSGRAAALGVRSAAKVRPMARKRRAEEGAGRKSLSSGGVGDLRAWNPLYPPNRFRLAWGGLRRRRCNRGLAPAENDLEVSAITASCRVFGLTRMKSR
jgi:hypothetical protein